MKIQNFTTLEELFSELINNEETYGLDSKLAVQLRGQVEEAFGLLSDVVEELQTISPEAITAIKSMSLQIFEREVNQSDTCQNCL